MSIEPAARAMHPVLSATAVIGQALTSVADVNPTFMRTETKCEVLREISVLEAQLADLKLRVLADAQDVAMTNGSRDAGVWLAHETRANKAAASVDLKLAVELDRRRLLVAAGMRAGAVNRAQAQVIVKALDRLPAEVPAETVTDAEAHLVAAAAEFGPEDLATLGRRILHVVAPEIAEGVEARALAREEAEARKKIRMSMRRLGDGTTRTTIITPDAVATRLAVYCEAHANPRRKDIFGEAAAPDGLTAEDLAESLESATANTGPLPDSTDPVERLPHAHRLGLAFCAFVEGIDPKRLPLHGGDATTLQITIDFEDLKKQHAVGDLLTTALIGGEDGTSVGGGQALTAGEIRRLACNAQIIPVVLGGDSEILDHGRARRLFTAAQQRAMLRRDRRCRAEGCDIPGTWAEAHHWIWWERGGNTDLEDGVLLCSHHHHCIHDEDNWSVERLPNGDVRFTRRT